jgi:tRNA(fMet)-specific endonuclease VapC
MKYLIDSDWIIEHLRGVSAVTKKLDEFAPSGMAISVISLAELYEGVYLSKNPAQSQVFLNAFLMSELKVLGVNEGVCKIFGRQRSKLRKQGNLIDNFDLLIASTALYYGLTILTNNRNHFERIEELTIISM